MELLCECQERKPGTCLKWVIVVADFDDSALRVHVAQLEPQPARVGETKRNAFFKQNANVIIKGTVCLIDRRLQQVQASVAPE